MMVSSVNCQPIKCMKQINVKNAQPIKTQKPAIVFKGAIYKKHKLNKLV